MRERERKRERARTRERRETRMERETVHVISIPPSKRRKGLVTIPTVAYHTRCIHNLMHIPPVSIEPSPRTLQANDQTSDQLETPPTSAASQESYEISVDLHKREQKRQDCSYMYIIGKSLERRAVLKLTSKWFQNHNRAF